MYYKINCEYFLLKKINKCQKNFKKKMVCHTCKVSKNGFSQINSKPCILIFNFDREMNSKMDKTSILIADPQFLVRAGLQCIISQTDEFRIVGEIANLQELPEALLKLRPQILITDHLAEGGLMGRLLDKINTLNPDLKILIISDDSDTGSIFRVLEKGICGFLTRSCDSEEILDALKAARRGDKLFCTRVLDALLEKSLGKTDNCLPATLSHREIEIVRLIAGGHVAREIAERLHLSKHTVYTHRKNIMRKLQLQTPSELMLYALSSGILESQEKW